MKIRVSTLTPFLLAALARGQVVSDKGGYSSKDLAAVPRPDQPLPLVACEGALKEDYDMYLLDWPEKQYGAEVRGCVWVCVCEARGAGSMDGSID